SWHECGRAAQSHLRSELSESPDVGAGDSAVKNIADDCDVESFDLSFTFANRKCIEQGLRGMFVRAITSIDDVCVDHAGEKRSCTSRAVADHNEIHVQRFEIFCG